MATPLYTTGQIVTLHFTRMTDGSTYLLLQRDGRSSGKCYHTASALPEHLCLRLRITQAHPACVYVALPADALHHSHLSFSPEELAAVDHTAATEDPTFFTQLTFDL